MYNRIRFCRQVLSVSLWPSLDQYTVNFPTPPFLFSPPRLTNNKCAVPSWQSPAFVFIVYYWNNKALNSVLDRMRNKFDLYSSAFLYLVWPAPFFKGGISSPIYIVGFFIKDQVAVWVWVYMWFPIYSTDQYICNYANTLLYFNLKYGMVIHLA